MKHYCKKCGHELGTLQIICPNCFYCEYADIAEEAGKAITPILSAEQLEYNTQWYKYRCGPHGLCGHGYAAEDLNGFYDKTHGKDVQFSGRDNSRFGADRIVDGIPIQTKYCRTADRTINAAFPNENNGDYAYWDENGEPQILEVPKDQYEKCVELMRQKIIERKSKRPAVNHQEADIEMMISRISSESNLKISEKKHHKTIAYVIYIIIIIIIIIFCVKYYFA